MEELFGSDGSDGSDNEVERENNGTGEGVTEIDGIPARTTTSTPHDILDIDEDAEQEQTQAQEGAAEVDRGVKLGKGEEEQEHEDEDEDRELKSKQKNEQPSQKSRKDEERDLFGSDDDDEDDGDGDGDEEMNESSQNEVNRSLEESFLVRKSHEFNRSEKDDLFGSDDENDDHEGAAGDETSFLNENPKSSTSPSFSKLCLPNITRLAEGGQILLKMPGFVKFQPKPYHTGKYDADVESRLFHHAPAIIRWRYKRNANGDIMKDAQGVPIRESNSRLVKWSDGTFHLIIGDETFEGQFGPVNDSFLYTQQFSAPPPQDGMESSQGESQSDFKKGSVLECVGSISNKLNIIVSSVTSVTHERMSLKTNEQYRKAIKIKKRVDSDINPEKESEARIGAINEQLKRERKRALQLQSDQYSSRGSVGYSSRASMSAAYLQEGFDDDRNYDSVSIKNIKKGDHGMKKDNKKFSSTKKSINLEDDDEEDDEDEDGDPAEMNDFIVNSDDDGDEDEEEEGEYQEGDGDGDDNDDDGDDDEEGDDDDDDEDEEGDEDNGNGSGKSKSKDKKGSKSSKKKQSKSSKSSKSSSSKKGDRNRVEKSREKNTKPSKKSSRRNDRDEDEDEDDDTAAVSRKKIVKGDGHGGGNEEDEIGESQQKKRLKRTIVDSDEDSS